MRGAYGAALGARDAIKPTARLTDLWWLRTLVLPSHIGCILDNASDPPMEVWLMNTTPHHHDSSLKLAERTLDQLDELVHHGHFADYQMAIAVAVERLYAE